MPLIKPRTNRVKSVRHICRLQEPNRDALVLYARFIGDTADYVLNQLIDTTIAKDRDFVAWRAEHPHEPSRRPTATSASGTRARPRPTPRLRTGDARVLIEYRFVISLALAAVVRRRRAPRVAVPERPPAPRL